MVGVYKIINNLDGRVYIGRSIDVETRIAKHFNYLIKDPHGELDRDIRRLGKENFSWELLRECTEEEMDDYEAIFIGVYDACNPEKGYNKKSCTTTTTNGNEKPIIDIDTFEKFKSTGDCARKLGISQGDITRVCNHLSGTINGRRFMYLDEYEEKGIIEYIPLKHGTKKKQVKCLENNEIYESAHEAGRQLNLNFRLITSVCNGKRKTTGGYHFQYI